LVPRVFKSNHYFAIVIIILLLLNLININLFVVADYHPANFEGDNPVDVNINNIEYNNTKELKNNNLIKIKETLNLDFKVNTISRSGHEYDQIIIDNGGIECGDHGEERPFYQHTIKTPGKITNIDLTKLVPYLTPSTPAPYLLPQKLGYYFNPELSDEWVGVPKHDVKYEWVLTHLSQTTVNDEPGELYSLKVYPVEYLSDGYARVYTQIEVAYSYNQCPIWNPILAPDPGYKPTGPIKYLIITHPDFEDAVQPLSTWKSQKGLFTQVTTTAEIDEMYENGDLPLKMRNYIADMEAKYDLEYLLLVGDWAKVPTRNTKNSYAQPMMGEPDNFASDLYFACVDTNSNWNKDGDIDYAEEGELDDAIPDMANGRLAVNSVSDLKNIINSLILREHELPWSANTTKVVYMVGDPGYIPGNPMELMDQYWIKYGQNIYSGKETIYYDESGTLNFTTDSFIEVMDDGYQAMSYFGHGQPTQIPNLFTTGQIGQLATAGPDGAFFTMACLTSWFDDPSYDPGMMGAVENCVGEVLTETNGKGLVGCIGSSRLAVGSIDTVYSDDAPGLQEDYWRSLKWAAEGNITPTVGHVWKEAVTHFSLSFYPFIAQSWDNPGLRTFLEYNLLGEPDAPLIFREPEDLELEYKVASDKNSVWVKVTNATNGPIENARVTIYREYELGRTALTDNKGELTLIIPPNNGGVINLTVSRPGDNPATTTFWLPDALKPQPEYSIDPETPDGENGYYVTNPIVTLFGNEPVKIEYGWDEGELNFSETETSVVAPEGNHTLKFRVVDMSNQWSDWLEIPIFVDMTPPDLFIVTDPETPDGNDGWFITCPLVALESSELIKDIHYTIDCGEEEEYIGPFQLEEGVMYIIFTASDLAGNNNDVGKTLKIDLTAPSSIIEMSHGPDGINDYYVTIPEIELKCPDEQDASVEYKWDNDEWIEYETPIYPEEGIHTLYYRGKDLGGNFEPVRNQTFKVDTVPPSLNLSLDPTEPDGLNGAYITSPRINIIISEGEAYYILGGVNTEINWTTSTKFIQEFTIPEGEHILHIKIVDLAGNELLIEPIQFTVDLTPPEFQIEVDPSTPDGEHGWYTSRPTVMVTSDSEETTIYWRNNDESEWIILEKDLDLNEGEQKISFKVVDNAGNVVHDETEWLKVDLTAPELAILTPEENEVVENSVVVEWVAIDDTSGILQYKIQVDEGIWSDMEDSTRLQLKDLEHGVHEIQLKAFDQAGNTITVTRNFELQILGDSDDSDGQDNDGNVVSGSDAVDEIDKGFEPGVVAGIAILTVIIIITVIIGLFIHIKNKRDELIHLVEMGELELSHSQTLPPGSQSYNAYQLPTARPLQTNNYMFSPVTVQSQVKNVTSLNKSPPYENQNSGSGGRDNPQQSPAPPPSNSPLLRPAVVQSKSHPITLKVINKPQQPRPKVVKRNQS
jgi:hypothetical protein